MSATSANENEEKFPFVLKPWIFLYRSVPTLINLPFTSISVTFIICCSFYLSAWRLSLNRMLILLGWPADHMDTLYATENLTAVVHSLHLCPVLAVLLLTQPYSAVSKMSSHPQWWQDCAHAMMGFCTGYMMYDFALSLLWRNYQPGVGFVISVADWCFIGHHFATSICMQYTLINGAGHMGVLAMMLWGELSNPIQNTMYTLDLAKGLGQECCSSIFMEEVIYPIVHFSHGLGYATLRIFFGPGTTMDITYRSFFTKEGKANIPLALKLFYMISLWGVLLGSASWVIEAVDIVKSYLIPSVTVNSDEL